MINLYVQSCYTFLSSTITIQSYIQSHASNRIAICDPNLHAAHKFLDATIKKRLLPIIGLETVIDSNTYLVFAKNNSGYKKLLVVASHYKLNTLTIKQLVDKDLVTIYVAESVDLPDGMHSTFYIGFDFTDFNFEVNVAEKLYEVVKDKYKVIAIPKVRCLHEEDGKYLSMLEAIKNNNPELVSDDNSLQFLRSKEQLGEMYKQYPDVIKATNDFIQSIDLSYIKPTYQLPTYYGDRNANNYLELLALKGMLKRIKNKNCNEIVYKKRLKMELDIIKTMGYSDYFLIVCDIVNYAKRNNVFVGPGRGSAVGSLVAYSLGITTIDPLQYNLFFERFLNPERISMPDIDLDFPDDKRDFIIDYVHNTYGSDYVASIVTFDTFQGRSAVRDVARMLKYESLYISEILKHIPPNAKDLKSMIKGELLQMASRYKEVGTILDYAIGIERLPRHTSTHAAGILITPKKIMEYTAVERGLNDLYQSQFEAKDLEQLGLLKFDFLGITNLKTIVHTNDMIAKNHNTTIELYNLVPSDKKVYDLLSQGETDGIFQLESQGVRQVLVNMKVSCFEDIVATLALYRPGPMDSIDDYISRKRGQPYKTIHSDLKPILDSTYGIIIYQEQIMQILNQFAGYTYAEADLVRRAISKKDAIEIKEQEQIFIKKSAAKGYDTILAKTVYDYIAKFARYGFNKSHSVAYAMIAYIQSYLKTYYPLEFYTVLLSYSSHSKDKVAALFILVRKLGISIVNPNINKSGIHYFCEQHSIVMPLSAINGLGRNVVEKIVEERKKGNFIDFANFLKRCAMFLSDKQIKNLIYASSFDEFGLSKKTLVELFEKFENVLSFSSLLPEITIEAENSMEYDLDELMKYEIEALGLNVQYHFSNKYKCYDLLINADTKHKSKVCAKIVKMKVITTKTNKKMAFVTIEDLSHQLDLVCFPDQYEKYRAILETKKVLNFYFKKEKRVQTSYIIESIEEAVKL